MTRKSGFPLQIEKQYLRAVDRYLNAIDKEVLAIVRKQVDLKEFAPKGEKLDALSDIFEFLHKLQKDFEQKKFLKTIEKSTKNVVKSVSNFSSRLTKIAFRNLMSRKVPESAFKELEVSLITPEQLDGVVKQNVELIKTVGKDYLSTIQSRIESAIREGKSQKELAQILQKDTKADRNRARFWASDQLGKAYGEVNLKNQQAAGFNKFIWRTQLDQRVRDKHLVLEGKEFSYDDLPVVDGRRIKPSEDYNCRCWSEPVLDDL